MMATLGVVSWFRVRFVPEVAMVGVVSLSVIGVGGVPIGFWCWSEWVWSSVWVGDGIIGVVLVDGGGAGVVVLVLWGLCGISWVMVSLAAGCWCGVYLLGNFLFLRETLPEPSIFTRYWWYCLTSITVPVRSHLLGW